MMFIAAITDLAWIVFIGLLIWLAILGAFWGFLMVRNYIVLRRVLDSVKSRIDKSQ